MGESRAAVCYPEAWLPSPAVGGHFKVVGAVHYGSDVSIGVRFTPGQIFARNSGYGRPCRRRVSFCSVSVSMG